MVIKENKGLPDWSVSKQTVETRVGKVSYSRSGNKASDARLQPGEPGVLAYFLLDLKVPRPG